MVGVYAHHEFRLSLGQPPPDFLHFGATFVPFDSHQIQHLDGYLSFSLVIHASVDRSECPTADFLVGDVLVDDGVGNGLVISHKFLVAEFQAMGLA